MAWAGLASVLVYMAGQWRDVAEFYKGRGARYGTMSVVSIIVFIGILMAVNYLATRQNRRWDFTANQVYSLSDQTVKILRELKEPVKFVVYDKATDFDRFRDRLDEFGYHSSNVTSEYVDPDREPTRAKAAEIMTYGTIVIEHQGRVEQVTNSDEQAITNALIKVVSGESRKVYFTKGHGEKSPTDDNERAGLTGAAQLLGNDNYGVEELVLIQQTKRPGRCHGRRRCGTVDRLSAAGDRCAQSLSRKGRQGAGAAGSAGQAGGADVAADQPIPR